MEIKFRAPHAIDATLSPWPRRLDGVEAHDNLTHWLIPHRRQTLLSYCREAKGAKALKAERAARVKAAADAAEQKLRAEEEQERELEKLANALGDRPCRHQSVNATLWRLTNPFPHRQQAARQGKAEEKKAEAAAAAAAAVQGGFQGEQRRQGRRGRLGDEGQGREEGQEGGQVE